MKNIILLIFLIAIGFVSKSQNQTGYAKKLDQVPAKEVIGELEDYFNISILYEPAWLDSLVLSGSFENADLEQVLNTLFVPEKIYFYQNNGQVILTKDARIIDQPKILNHFQSTKSNQNLVPQGMIFAKDMVATSLDIEEKVIEIGSRAELKPGNNSTLYGYVKNVETGEPVIGALIFNSITERAAQTDQNGFYSISLPNGRHTLKFQSMEMVPTKREVAIFSDGNLNVNMQVNTIALREVVIESEGNANVTDVKMGLTKLNLKETKNVPLALGENDLMKVATTMAGIQTIGEGGAGYNVRGGKSDQNLITLDDAPIFNANHFFGFFSVFNPDAVNGADIYKGSLPAQYGGRLSSVFDVDAKRSKAEQFEGAGGISPVSARLSVEIPTIEKKAAISLAGRTTYSNWVLDQVDDVQFTADDVRFSDLMVGYAHELDDRNQINYTGYFSHDQFQMTSDTLFSFTDIKYQNFLSSLKWTRQLNDKVSGALTGYFSNYHYDLVYDQSAVNGFKQDFGISELGLKLDGDYYHSDQHYFLWGGGLKYYSVNPGSKNPLSADSEVLPISLQKKKARELFLYASDEHQLSDQLKLSIGFRYSLFQAVGSRLVQTYSEGAAKNSSTVQQVVDYGAGEPIATYHLPEYRLSMRYALDETSSLKLGINRTTQNVHALSNSASLSPTDTWTLSGYHIKPQTANQVSIGYFKNLRSNQFEFSIESYYKSMRNLLDFKSGGDFLLNDHVETVALQGDGKSYGVEFSLKKSGKLNGWVNYTYARSMIKQAGAFAEETINNGAFYPTNYDKPHTINLVANYKVTRRINFSSNVVFNTGIPVTYPVASYDFKGVQTIHYGDRNAFRIPNYFRVDIGFTLEESHLIKKFSHAYWSLSIYNLFGRDNPYSVFFDTEGGDVNGYQLVIFGSPIPTFSYNFRF